MLIFMENSSTFFEDVHEPLIPLPSVRFTVLKMSTIIVDSSELWLYDRQNCSKFVMNEFFISVDRCIHHNLCLNGNTVDHT